MEENDVEDENDSDNDDENIIDEGDIITNRNTYLYVIETGTFVAMRCPTNSLELLFLGEVLSKDVALTDKMDQNGHCVLKGDKFIEVHYLERDKGKHYIQYKRSNQPTSFIHLAEVFACHVELDLELKMKPSEYQSLTMEA